MKTATKTAKKWRCAECGFKYTSPLPVAEVQHDCKKAMPVLPSGKRATRRGMQPDE